jgi:hypothetical protein
MRASKQTNRQTERSQEKRFEKWRWADEAFEREEDSWKVLVVSLWLQKGALVWNSHNKRILNKLSYIDSWSAFHEKTQSFDWHRSQLLFCVSSDVFIMWRRNSDFLLLFQSEYLFSCSRIDIGICRNIDERK